MSTAGTSSAMPNSIAPRAVTAPAGQDAKERSEYVRLSPPRPPIRIADVIGSLRRHWRYPLVGLVLGLMAAVGYLAIAKTPYRSSARIMIDRSMNRYLQTNRLIDQPMLDDTDISSQLYLLSSDSVILPVVRSLNLMDDQEMARGGLMALLRSGESANSDGAAERDAAEAVLSHLTVFREDVANVINVTFESASPKKAADIANGIADAYVATTRDAKMKSTKLVTQWLEERLIELKQQSAAADRAIQEYRKANNLSNDSIGTVDAQFISALKSQLAAARVAVAEAKERLQRVQRTDPGRVVTAMSIDALVNPLHSAGVNYALTNSDTTRLRAQQRELEARLSEIEARVGPKHQAVIKLRAQLEAVERSVVSEEKRIADSYADEFQIAKARENELSATAQNVLGEGEANAQLRDLESAAETLRNLYNGFLQKHREITAAQAETIPMQSAHIITRATPPLHRSAKKAIVAFGGCLAFGLMLGAGFGIGRDVLADVLRTRKAVEFVTQRPCVLLRRIDPADRPIVEHVLSEPYSEFSEMLREVKISIDASLPRTEAKVIGIVSTLPDEGKTVVASNLAALMTAAGCNKTLIIDCDLHTRGLTSVLAPGAREGLLEALENPLRLPRLVSHRAASGVDVLACVSPDRVPIAAELLGSDEMARVIEVARRQYDYVVVKIPPIHSHVDVKTIERFIDAFVMVIEWGTTKRSDVVDALATAQIINDRIVSVVLNKVETETLPTIESLKNGWRQ